MEEDCVVPNDGARPVEMECEHRQGKELSRGRSSEPWSVGLAHRMRKERKLGVL